MAKVKKKIVAKKKVKVAVKKKSDDGTSMGFSIESPTLFDLKTMAINVIEKLGGSRAVANSFSYEDYYCLLILSNLNITKESPKNFFLFGKQWLS